MIAGSRPAISNHAATRPTRALGTTTTSRGAPARSARGNGARPTSLSRSSITPSRPPQRSPTDPRDRRHARPSFRLARAVATATDTVQTPPTIQQPHSTKHLDVAGVKRDRAGPTRSAARLTRGPTTFAATIATPRRANSNRRAAPDSPSAITMARGLRARARPSIDAPARHITRGRVAGSPTAESPAGEQEN